MIEYDRTVLRREIFGTRVEPAKQLNIDNEQVYNRESGENPELCQQP